MVSDGGQVTQLLKAMRAGDSQAAENLLPLVYAELHRLAKAYMRRERPDHTLQATALINEAYLRLVGEDVDWNSRAHFIGSAAHVMRRVRVDYARTCKAEQRGLKPLEMQEGLAISAEQTPVFASANSRNNGRGGPSKSSFYAFFAERNSKLRRVFQDGRDRSLIRIYRQRRLFWNLAGRRWCF
jgi:DNA-directed RNA polymerase specialized sigma24 family protein